MTTQTTSEFLTINEAAAMAGCNRQTIHRWFRERKLTRYEVGPGRRPRVKKAELQRHLTPHPALLCPDRTAEEV